MNRISQNTSALLLYTVMVSLVFFGVVTGKGVFFAGDIQQHYIPWESFIDEQYSSGEFPLWNPAVFGGHPIHAEGQSGTLYPISRAVYSLFDGARAFSLDMLLHLVLGGFFLYLLGRRINLGFYPSLYAGAVYTLAGYPVSLIVNAPILRSSIWIPLVALLVISIWHDKKFRPSLLLALIITLQIFAGSMQVAAMTLVLILFLSVFQFAGLIIRGNIKFDPIPYIVGAVLLGFLLASIQILPTFFLYQKSFLHQKAISPSSTEISDRETEALEYSFSPYHLIDMITPPYWAQNPEILSKHPDIPFQMTLFLYIGTIPFLLALIGFLLSKPSNTWRFLAVIGVLIALGGYTFFYPMLLKIIPPIGMFRAPDRYLFMYAISASILAGYGFRLFLGKEMPNDPKFKRRWIIPVSVITGILLIGGLVIDYYFMPGIVEKTYENLRHGLLDRFQSPVRTTDFSLIFSVARYQLLFSVLIILTLGFATTILWSSKYKTVFVGTLIFLLSFCEVGYYIKANPGTRLISPDYFTSPAKSAELIHSYSQSENNSITAPFRIHSMGAFEHGVSTFGHDNLMLWYHGGGRQFDYFKFREIMNPNYGNIFGFNYISGISSLYTSAWDRYTHIVNVQEELFIQQPHFFQTKVHFWDLSGVRFIISNTRLPEGRLQLLSEGNVFVYENKRVLPRALILYPTRVFPESDQVSNELMLGRLNPVDNLILNTAKESSYRRGSMPDSRKFTQVTINTYEPKRVVITGVAEIDGFLIFTDTFDTGWECKVNGESKTVYRAYTYFRAVPIKAGRFEAVFDYKPSEFTHGMITSIAVAIIWFILFLLSFVGQSALEDLED